MKSILTLIKLEQRKLDDLRRLLKSLQDEEAMLIAKKEELAESMISEQKKALTDLALTQTLAAFLKMTKRNIAGLEEVILLTRKKIEQAQAQIAIAFGELKKLEIYRDLKDAQAEEKQNQREQKMLDEMGLRRFTFRSET